MTSAYLYNEEDRVFSRKPVNWCNQSGDALPDAFFDIHFM
jgi:hypothetical protein